MSRRNRSKNTALAVRPPTAVAQTDPYEFDPDAPRSKPPTEIVPDYQLENQIAPPPIGDRFPIIIGTNITMSYISSVCRLALTGYRRQLVDVLSEFLDHDPHTFAVLSRRMTAISGGRLEYAPADDSPEAKRICDELRADMARLPKQSSSIEELAWHALYFGIGAQEVMWTIDGGRMRPIALELIHSRRISAPDVLPFHWRIYDDSPGGGAGSEAPWGLAFDALPGKFLVWEFQCRGEYGTREGLGRLLLSYLAIKRLVLRSSAQDWERFLRTWVIAYFNTAASGTTTPRAASAADIKAGQAAMAALGTGSLTSAILPDSLKIELQNAAMKLDFEGFTRYLDTAITKAVLTNSLSTESGKFGDRGSAEVGKEASLALTKSDCCKFSDVWQSSIVDVWMKLNYPGKAGITPRSKLHVEEPVSRIELMQAAQIGVGMGMPVDGAALARMTGLPLLTPGQAGAIRLAPVSPIDPSRLVPEILPEASDGSPDAKLTQLTAQPIDPAIALSDKDGPLVKWCEIAIEGSYRKQIEDREVDFTLNSRVFSEIVANFEAQKNKFIRLDYEHMSEPGRAPPDVVAQGLPAAGWITALDNRGSSLWAKIEFLEPAATYVREKRYRGLSPAIRLNPPDNRGVRRGAVMSSVALTNSPFLEMTPIAARRDDADPFMSHSRLSA